MSANPFRSVEANPDIMTTNPFTGICFSVFTPILCCLWAAVSVVAVPPMINFCNGRFSSFDEKRGAAFSTFPSFPLRIASQSLILGLSQRADYASLLHCAPFSPRPGSMEFVSAIEAFAR